MPSLVSATLRAQPEASSSQALSLCWLGLGQWLCVAWGGPRGPKLKRVEQHIGGQGRGDTPTPVPPESGDVKATVAVLSFILSSAAKHSVDSESLSSELQQLGLPKGTGWGRGQAHGEPLGPASQGVP